MIDNTEVVDNWHFGPWVRFVIDDDGETGVEKVVAMDLLRLVAFERRKNAIEFTIKGRDVPLRITLSSEKLAQKLEQEVFSLMTKGQ